MTRHFQHAFRFDTNSVVLEQDLGETDGPLSLSTYALPEGTDRPTAVQMFRDSIPRYMAK